MSELNFTGHDLNDLDIDSEIERALESARAKQRQVEAAQKAVLATTITGTAERGLVTVTMSGGGRFTGVTIDRDAVRRFEPHVLSDVVLDAIHDAMGQLAKLTRERFGPLISDPAALERATTYWKPEDSGPRRPR